MADDYWIDIVPSRLQISGGRKKSQVGADDYIINPGKVGDRSMMTTVGDRSFGAVGADDYHIERVGADDYHISNVGGTHKAVSNSRRRSRRARGGFEDDYHDDWPIYIVRNDDVVSPEDNMEPHPPMARTDVPDEVSGPYRHRRRYGRYPMPEYWPSQPVEINLNETDEVSGMNVFQYTNATNALIAEIKAYVAKHPGANVNNDPKMKAYAKKAADLKKQEPHNALGDAAKAAGKGIATATGDIIHTVNAGVNLVAKGLSHIPVVGGALSTALRVSTSGPAMLERVAKGQRIDKAFIQLGKEELKNVRAIAPYVQQVMAFIPGVGTGVAAAIAAGTALAEGKSITQALLSAAKGAIPGGALAGSAFDAALKVVKPGVSAAVVDAARNALPPQAQKAFDIGTAYAHARNVQSAVVTAATKPAAIAAVSKVGQQLLKQAPNVAQAAKGLSSEATKGFHVGAGLLAHSGVNPHAVVAMRSKLPPAQQAGFDHAAKTLLAAVTPHWPSMVVNGIVTRGDWKACRPGAKGCVSGYHVNPITKKVTKGTFTRA
jgi:hypothetical protein